jgi:hypothetical protein
MDSYYCIISTDRYPVADLCVLDARDDETALTRASAATGGVAGWARVRVYAGERVVGQLERETAPEALPLAA